jgi:hypothetical protein
MRSSEAPKLQQSEAMKKTKHNWRLWLLTRAEENLLEMSKDNLYLFTLLAQCYYSA